MIRSCSFMFSSTIAICMLFTSHLRGQEVDKDLKLRLIGNGALGITAGENITSGAFGLDFRAKHTRFTALITVESTAGNIESSRPEAFGESLLPIRNTDTGLFLLARRNGILWGGGVQAYVNTGSVKWTYVTEMGDERLEQVEDLTTTAGGANLLWDPFNAFTIENNDVRLLIGGGYTFRAISGDLAHADNAALRQTLLGTDDTFFHGPEAVAILQINDVDVTFSLPFLIFGDDVDGLTGGRPFGAVNVQAGLDLGLKRR